MRVRSSTRNSTLIAAALALAGAAGLAATAVLDGGAAAVAGSALVLLVGAGVLVGHGFDAASEAWPRSWLAAPVVLVAAGVLGVGDAVGAFGSTEPLGLPVSVALVVAGLGFLVRRRDKLPGVAKRDRSERHRPHER